MSPQPGIFALGTASHAYLELDARDPHAAVAIVAGLREPRTTLGGVNLVVGFRPSLWREFGDVPADVHDFDAPVGPMPATQHDVVLWVAGAAYDVVFDVCRDAIRALAPVAHVSSETSSWPYHRDRDLTGFEDGTENPPIAEAVAAATREDGSSILLLQKWPHDSDAWESLSQEEQERVIGRTKPDSVELDPRPESSHVARTDQEDFGHIFRRNMPYGTVTQHGTMFVGFSAEQSRLHRMLESMAGGDALMRYTTPISGSYYVVPAAEALTLSPVS